MACKLPLDNPAPRRRSEHLTQGADEAVSSAMPVTTPALQVFKALLQVTLRRGNVDDPRHPRRCEASLDNRITRR